MTWTLLVHGGAGTPPPEDLTPEREAAYHAGLPAALEAGRAVLDAGGAALDAVVAAVAAPEDAPPFNAGRGSTFTHGGRIGMDAAVMDGAAGRAGAVAGVTRVRNPACAARLVMGRTPHVLPAGPAADAFAEAEGLATGDPACVRTDHRRAQWRAALAAGQVALGHDDPARAPRGDLPADGRVGTVGAVARDAAGWLAAATSTGGTTNKRDGRSGDGPLPGAGTWADAAVAVPRTGTGEAFIRHAAAHGLSAPVRHRGTDVRAAAEQVPLELVPAAGGRGGLLAVDTAGEPAVAFATAGMHRGVWRAVRGGGRDRAGGAGGRARLGAQLRRGGDACTTWGSCARGAADRRRATQGRAR